MPVSRGAGRQPGFSLIELAVVLFIVSLLVGGLLVPLATQMEARQRNEALKQLEMIKEALIGFALVKQRLPYCTKETNPGLPGYGEEDSTCNPADPSLTADQILPWKTLGLASGMDPWGIQRTSGSDPWIGYWRYRVRSGFSLTSPLITLSTDSPYESATSMLCIVDTGGNLLVSASETPVALIYSTGADQTADGQNASYESTSASTDCLTNTPILYQGGEVSGDFDDVTAWLTRPLLFNRLVTAGVLP